MDEPAHIVWLKRDLRLQDHAPIRQAAQAGRVLPLYILEPSLVADAHYAERHWRFVQQSLEELRRELRSYDSDILFIHDEVQDAFAALQQHFRIESVHSHAETGLAITYARDRQMKSWFREQGIPWHEYPNNGVQRGRRNRRDWRKSWYAYMSSPIPSIDLDKVDWLPNNIIEETGLSDDFLTLADDPLFQRGGRSHGLAYLHSFLDSRVKDYVGGISSPSKSRKACSRISPYIAWGCFSVREIYQAQKVSRDTSPSKRGLQGFASRLRWQAHFIQKFEMEERMEFENVNRGFDALEKPLDEVKVKAWEEGRTGYPLVDACMRCLQSTGYINFRMRAMLVSFLCHHLWQPWQAGTHHLSSLFLDFEPGIHYPQFQMQAGMTGINTVRIYNPVKQAEDHDPEASFIRQWLPELRALPSHFAREPWTMTDMEAAMLGFEKGSAYPEPIVDIAVSGRMAREAIWALRKSPETRSESARILAKHTLPGRRHE